MVSNLEFPHLYGFFTVEVNGDQQWFGYPRSRETQQKKEFHIGFEGLK